MRRHCPICRDIWGGGARQLAWVRNILWTCGRVELPVLESMDAMIWSRSASFKNPSKTPASEPRQVSDEAWQEGCGNEETLAQEVDLALVLCGLPANKIVSTDWAEVQRTSRALKCCRIFRPPDSAPVPECYWLREENGGEACLHAVRIGGSV